jgi:hypothetical protein
MGELIQANFSVIHTDDDSNKSTRFMDETISHVPISHNTGKATLPGGTKDHEIASSVNMAIMYCTGPISIKVGDTTAPELTNVRMWAYDGDTTTIFVSNPGTDPVKILTTFAKF